MGRILAVSDEVDRALYETRPGSLDVELIVSCGDLPYDYLEYLATVINRPLVYVPGNHDPAPDTTPSSLRPGWIAPSQDPPGPAGGTSVDGRVIDVAGMRLAGLGGSMRYSSGPHQYNESEMRRRALKLEARARFARWRDRRAIDVFIAHIPPALLRIERDHAHRGSSAFDRLLAKLSPRVMLYGHIHPHGHPIADVNVNGTRVINVVPFRIVEL